MDASSVGSSVFSSERQNMLIIIKVSMTDFIFMNFYFYDFYIYFYDFLFLWLTLLKSYWL